MAALRVIFIRRASRSTCFHSATGSRTERAADGRFPLLAPWSPDLELEAVVREVWELHGANCITVSVVVCTQSGGQQSPALVGDLDDGQGGAAADEGQPRT